MKKGKLLPAPFEPDSASGWMYELRLTNGVGVVLNPANVVLAVFLVEPFELVTGDEEVARWAQPYLI